MLTRREALAGAAAVSTFAQPARRRPNVLFYFPDQLRAQEAGYNGGRNMPTPHIDKLASQGVVFTNAISSCPLCTPYRAMLQTGRWPALSGGVMNWVNLPSTGQSMADTFAKAGYDTGFIGKWHLAAGARAGSLKRGEPVPQQKEPEFVPPGPMRMGYRHWEAFNFHANFAKAFYYRDTPERLIMPGYETDSETDMAIEFMRQRARSGNPFFLVVAPHPPHPPWRRDQTPAKNLEATRQKLHWRPNVKGRKDMPNYDPRCYYAMIGNVDDNVGRLMRFLDESGLAENTVVVFTSDHGEMLASQGRYNKMVPYAEAVDVPLIIRWPGHTRAGAKTDALYTPMDHFPTLAGLCGLAVPGIVNGMDLSANALGKKGKDRDAALMMNYVSHWDYPETMTEWPEWRGLRTRQHTYVRWLNGAEELYDNAADPYQMRNLFDGLNSPAVLEKLRARLKDLLAESHDEFFPGDRFSEWFTPQRDQVRNALGPVPRG
ncbi:MAG: sulfatase [Acidobacteria bacterium]|nr:sulfatase [Acidobacteriota bacterium]